MTENVRYSIRSVYDDSRLEKKKKKMYDTTFDALFRPFCIHYYYDRHTTVIPVYGSPSRPRHNRHFVLGHIVIACKRVSIITILFRCVIVVNKTVASSTNTRARMPLRRDRTFVLKPTRYPNRIILRFRDHSVRERCIYIAAQEASTSSRRL